MQNTLTTITKSLNQDSLSTLATPTLLANGRVPASHKQIANNYIVIKRLYKSQSIKSQLLYNEKELLGRYNLSPLSQLSIQDMNKEILMLQEWAFSTNHALKDDADAIMQIRSKELRFILSSNYSLYSSEFNNGFRSLERYFEEITKFYNLPH